MHRYRAFLFLFILLIFAKLSLAGTNIITSKGATADKSLLVSFSTDSHSKYGYLRQIPARTQDGDSVRLKIYDSQTDSLRGEITQPAQSYSVTGIMNERQVTIAECTFTCRAELLSSEGIFDYTNLILYTLQQARSARHAIKLISQLTERYGYYGLGESLAIADIQEAWIMEFVGKGPGRKGVLWVARRIPEGYISAQANMSRIGKFPLNDISSCLFSQDLIRFAREKNLFTGLDGDFSFRDTYAPLTYEGFIWGEARVWSVFSRVAPSQKFPCVYTNSAISDKLPLWVKPDKLLTLANIQALMRNHYESTPIDMTRGTAAGKYGLPYRPQPYSWVTDSLLQYHFRPISVQHTRCSGVAHLRHWLPGSLGGVLWFGVDDSYFTLYQPMYCGILSAPHSLRDMTEVDDVWGSQYWTFNLVSNYAYTRYRDMAPVVVREQDAYEKELRQSLATMDDIAAELYILQPDSTRRLITQYCDSVAQASNQLWQQMAVKLIVQFPPATDRPAGRLPISPRTYPALKKRRK